MSTHTILEHTVQSPFIVHGISNHGPYIKVRGTAVGGTWAIANVPFAADDSRFYSVKDAADIANLIADIPHMLKLLAVAYDEPARNQNSDIANLFKKHKLPL